MERAGLFHGMKTWAECRLYAFVDAAYLDGRAPGELARALCGGGADVVQARAKGWGRDRTHRLVDEVLPVVTRFGARFVLNDDWSLGCELGVSCVHLGQEDFFGAGRVHRDGLPGSTGGPELGLSSHAPEQFRRAESAGAAYVAAGPVFATPTKPGRPAVTLDYVRWASANARMPWFAIGGIDPATLDSVLEAGATRVCVVSALLRRPDVEAATRALRARLG